MPMYCIIRIQLQNKTIAYTSMVRMQGVHIQLQITSLQDFGAEKREWAFTKVCDYISNLQYTQNGLSHGPQTFTILLTQHPYH